MFRSAARFFLYPSSQAYRFLSYCYNYPAKGHLPKEIQHINPILKQLSEVNKKVHFIQVGSNDGITGDPIHHFVQHYQWYGVLIEPMPMLFEQLKKTYEFEKERLQFLNVAVSADNQKSKTIYCINEKFRGQVPDWYYQLGSFVKEVILKHNIQNIEDYLVENQVPVLTIQHIKETYLTLDSIDFLHIDAEGYDFEILKTLDFLRNKPSVILVEYVHLDIATQKQMLAMFKRNGYTTYRCHLDFIALEQSVHNRYVQETLINAAW